MEIVTPPPHGVKLVKVYPDHIDHQQYSTFAGQKNPIQAQKRTRYITTLRGDYTVGDFFS